MASSAVPKLLFPRPSPVSGSLPKWQLALVVGTPIALGLGYMCYKNYVGKPEEDSDGKSKRSAKENGIKQISIDGDFPADSGNVTVNETMLEKAQRFKNEGNKFFNMGKFDEAISQYNIAIDVCPAENKDALATFYQNRAAAYEKLQKYNAVRDDCTKALELKPMYIKALTRRARVLEIKKDFETALEDITTACILEKFGNQNTLFTADAVLKQLGKQHAQEYMATKKVVMPSKHFINVYISTFHNDPLIQKKGELVNEENMPSFNKALAAVKNQEYDDVIPFCLEELANFGSDAESINKMKVLLLRGTFYLLLGEHEKSLEDLSTVINHDISTKELKVNALIKRASMYVQLENVEKSFIDFEHAEKLDPECGDIFHNRGQVHLLLEKLEEAKRDFEKAATLHPDFDVAYVQKCYTDYRYAVSQRDLNMVNDSMSNFNKALDKFPKCSECHTLYAQMLLDTREFDKADSYFQQAFNCDPKNASILVYRGLLQLQWHNDLDKAVEYIKEAIEIDDKCEFAYETLGSIEVQRGNLKEAISIFDKAIALARTSVELRHIFSLRDAAKAQLVVNQRMSENLDDISSFKGLS